MVKKNIILPSNKKFGFFFTFIFLIISLYFFYYNKIIITYFFLFISLILFTVSFLKPKYLYFFNLMWMKFGLIISKIVSPIILGIIFFGLICPLGFFLKIIGRDELLLKMKKEKSFWLNKQNEIKLEGFFNNQF